MANYKNYQVWERSHKLVINLYKLTAKFPKQEQYNLTSQINRAVLPIPTNIAEGCGRETQKEFVRFLYFSSGSAHELEYLITVSNELNLIKEEESKNILMEIDQIKKMLHALITTIKKSL